MFEVVEDVSSVKVDKGAYLYMDTETIGLYGKIRLVQLYQSHWDKVIIFDTYKTKLKEVVNLIKECPLVLHNGFYDLRCLYLHGFDLYNFEDTFLLGRLHYAKLESFALDSMLEACLGFCPYSKHGLNKSQMQKYKWQNLLMDDQLLYSAIDVFYLPKLMGEIYHLMDSPSYILDKLSVLAMLEFSRVGLPVSEELLEEEKLATKLKIENFKDKYPDIKVNSPQQIKKILNVDSTNDKELAKLEAEGVTFAKDVREWRKQEKKLNFISRFNKPRIYGNFNVATKSGRSNCSDENLQQIPSSLKRIFQTDKFFVYADFSNLELRTFCAMVGERVMERMFREDIDLHTYSAHKLFKIPMHEVTKTQRQIAKTFNFSSLYGAGVQTRLNLLLANTGIALELEEGYRLAKEWLNTYPEVKIWQDKNVLLWERGALGKTALGRPYSAKLYTDFCNIQIQGSGAEVAKVALVKMLEYLDTQKLCAFIHDSYTFEVDTLDEAKYYAEVLANSMQEAWFEVSQYFKITNLPMPVLASVGKNWKDLQADENLIYTFEV